MPERTREAEEPSVKAFGIFARLAIRKIRPAMSDDASRALNLSVMRACPAGGLGSGPVGAQDSWLRGGRPPAVKLCGHHLAAGFEPE